MATTITATELARSLSDVLNRVHYRNERFVIQRNGETIATIAPPGPVQGVTLKEVAEKLRGLEFPDPEFADDLEEIQANQPRSEFPRSRLTTWLITLGPSAQIVVCENGALRPGTMLLPNESSRSRSSGRPCPCNIRYRTFSIQPEPSRHGVHLPHDSCAKNFASRQLTSSGSVSSSNTVIEPEPSIVRSSEPA